MSAEKHKGFRCPYHGCNKCFTKSSNLNQHVRIHSGEKPFPCSICHQTFRQSGNLTKHIKSHENAHLRWNRSTKDKPYKCNQCEKSFTANSSLQNHLKQHELPNSISEPAIKRARTAQAQQNSTAKLPSTEIDNIFGHDDEEESESEEEPDLKLASQTSASDSSKLFFCRHAVCGAVFDDRDELRTHIYSCCPDLLDEAAFLHSSLRKLVALIEDKCINNPDEEFSAQLRAIGFSDLRIKLRSIPLLQDPSSMAGVAALLSVATSSSSSSSSSSSNFRRSNYSQQKNELDNRSSKASLPITTSAGAASHKKLMKVASKTTKSSVLSKSSKPTSDASSKSKTGPGTSKQQNPKEESPKQLPLTQDANTALAPQQQAKSQSQHQSQTTWNQLCPTVALKGSLLPVGAVRSTIFEPGYYAAPVAAALTVLEDPTHVAYSAPASPLYVSIEEACLFFDETKEVSVDKQ